MSRHRLAFEHVLVAGTAEQIGVEAPQVRRQRCLVRIPARGVDDSKIIGIPVNPVFPHRQSRRSIRAGRENVAKIIDIDQERQTELLQVVDTSRMSSLFFCLGEGGEEQRRQNGDDGDDHQQFD